MKLKPDKGKILANLNSFTNSDKMKFNKKNSKQHKPNVQDLINHKFKKCKTGGGRASNTIQHASMIHERPIDLTRNNTNS